MEVVSGNMEVVITSGFVMCLSMMCRRWAGSVLNGSNADEPVICQENLAKT